ncbi:MAG: RND family transporter [Deltaproteobacteria bacterium]|nr:RND family transporter [Deltaproteobacteria bacterium]
MERITGWVVRLRWVVIAAFVGITAFFAAQIPDARMDPEVKNQLPTDMPSRLDLDRIEELFGGTDMTLVLLQSDDVLTGDTLGRIRRLTRRFERLRPVDRVMSLFTLKDIRAEGGDMIVDPAVKRVPKDEAGRRALRESLERNEFVYGNVVSKDFTTAAIIVFKKMDASDEELLSLVEKAIEENPGDERVVYGGMPFIRKTMSEDMRHDLRLFLPAGLAIMLVFLFLSFRQLRGVLLPFLVVCMAIVVGLGLIPLLGWKIQMVTIILPVILIAVANDYGIHLMAAYQENNQPGRGLDRKGLALVVGSTLGKPIVATGVTTMAGLLCLMAHEVVPAERLGILSSAGIAFALLASLAFVPAVLSLLPVAAPVTTAASGEAGASGLEKLLIWNARLVTRHPGAVTGVSAVLLAVFAVGIFWLRVDTNPVNYYTADSPVVESADLVNRHLGGVNSVSVVAQGDIKDPAVMARIDDLERSFGRLPIVGHTSSLARTLRKMNRVMNGDDPAFDKVPDSRKAIAQYLLLYSMSGDPEDFERLVDFPYEHALVTARIKTASSRDFADVAQFARDAANRDDSGTFTRVSGFAVVYADLVDAVIDGQLLSLALSVLLVALMVSLLLRSPTAGLLTLVPLGLAAASLFGLMGLLGIELNLITAMLSSIMIGVGVDYTIHFLWRYREERRGGSDPVTAMVTTLTTTGRGIVFNALSVIVGFTVTFGSSFLPVRYSGFLIVVSIGMCLLGALQLLPAVALLTRPRFLEPPAPPRQ